MRRSLRRTFFRPERPRLPCLAVKRLGVSTLCMGTFIVPDQIFRLQTFHSSKEGTQIPLTRCCDVTKRIFCSTCLLLCEINNTLYERDFKKFSVSHFSQGLLESAICSRSYVIFYIGLCVLPARSLHICTGCNRSPVPSQY